MREPVEGALPYNESLGEIAFPRFRKFSQEAFSPRMVGFAFSRAWVFVAFSPSLLLQSHDQPGVMGLLYTLSLAALVASLLAGGLSGQRCERLMLSRAGKLLSAGLSILGTTALVFSGLDTPPGLACLIVAALATGMGSGLFVLYWGRAYSRRGGPMAAAEVSVAYMLATLPVALFLMLPAPLQFAVVTLLPVASSLVLFWAVLRPQPLEGPVEDAEDRPGDGGHSPALPPRAARHAPGSPAGSEDGWNLETIGLNWRRVMFKFASSSIIFGCVVSLMHELYSMGDRPLPGLSAGIALFISAFVAGAILLVVLFFSKRLDLAFTYRPVLIFMSLGCLLLPFIGLSGSIAWVLTMAGYLGFEIMNWVALSDMAFRFDLPAFRVFGYGRAAVSGGVLIGALLARWLNSNLVFDFQGSAALSFAMVFVLIVTYTFTLTERDIAKLTRIRARVPFREADGQASPSLDDRVLLLAEEHGVSGRGLEVLLLLAKGRTGTRIEQELYMSRGTVNTHLRRLYQKLGVHTRQDLLDLIDSVCPAGPAPAASAPAASAPAASAPASVDCFTGRRTMPHTGEHTLSVRRKRE